MAAETDNDVILRKVGGQRLSYNVTIVPLSIEGRPQKLEDLRTFIHSLTGNTQIYAARTPEEWDYCILKREQPRLDNAFKVFSHLYRSREGLSIPGQLNRLFYSSCCRAYRRLVGEDLPEYKTARLVAALSGECGYCPSPLMPTWRWFDFFKKTGFYKTPDDEYPKYYVQSEQEQKDTRWHLEDFVYSQRRLSQEISNEVKRGRMSVGLAVTCYKTGKVLCVPLDRRSIGLLPGELNVLGGYCSFLFQPLEVRKAYRDFARDVMWRRNDEVDLTRLSCELDELEWKEGHKAVVFVQADAMGELQGSVDKENNIVTGDQQTTLKRTRYPPGNALIISNLSAAAVGYLFRGQSFIPKIIAGATVAGWVSVGLLCRSVSLANNALTRLEHKFGDSMLAEAIEVDAMSDVVTHNM